MNEPHQKYIFLQLCTWWNDTEITKQSYTSHHIGSVFSHEMLRYWPAANRRQPTDSAAELDLMLWLTQILHMNIHALPCKGNERKHRRNSHLPSCVFPWTPQQRLRVQPDLFCCTQNLPRSPLQWEGGPEVMDGFKMLLSRSEMLQFVLRALVMLHLALQIYFMIGWYVSYCMNKGCSSDMVHSHALCRMRCVQNHTEQTALSLDNKNPELNCISTSCHSLTHLGSLVTALHYDQNRLNILLCPSHLTFSLHDGTSAGHDHAKIESRCRNRAIC